MNISTVIRRDQLARKHLPLVYVMLGRLLLLGLLLMLIMVFSPHPVNLQSVSLFMAITFVLAILYALWLQRADTVKQGALYQFTVDVFIITGLVHFTGGIGSSLVLLYPLLILVAGIVVSGRLAIRVALLAVCLYSLLMILEITGTLPYQGPEPSPYAFPAQAIQTGLMQILLFSFFAAASSYLADRYLYQNRQLHRLRDMAKSTLSSVSVPLLAVQRPGGLIRLANRAACHVLQKKAGELEGRPFDDFFAGPSPPLEESDREDQHVWWMNKADGAKFPASFEISGGSLSGALLNIFEDGQEQGEVCLVAFRDMTRVMAREEDIRNTEKTDTAVGMVTEMAHVVRNPLTAIRGASELINAAVEAALARQQQITEAEFLTLKSMCEVIFDQTRELDNKVQDFMNYAAHDRKKLLDLISNANLWGKRVIRVPDTMLAPEKED